MRARGEGRGEPHGRARGAWMSPRELLDGARISEVVRRGKRLGLVAADGRALVVQLGMSGQLSVGCEDDRHVHVEWEAGRSALRFRDPRRFGGLTAYRSAADMRAAWDEALGPDALAVTASELAASLRGVRAVKAALLDQRVVAGVGNIYADESLHLAGIDPRTRCSRLGDEAVDRLARSIRTILARAVASGGSTLRDHRSASGEPGSAQGLHAVYGRSGKPCLACGAAIRSIRLGGRSTAWCPGCQRRS
jgi:formamidopyrimidine-DNA glycosylase